MLKKLTNIGVRKDQPEWLRRKIELTNYMALIFAFGVGVPFVIISLLFYPPLAIYPSVGTFMFLSPLFLNRFRWFTLSRLLMALVPILVAAFFNGGFSQVDQVPAFSLKLVEFSFFIFSLLLFDISERRLMIFSGAIGLSVLLLFAPINGLIEYTEPLDYREFALDGWLAYLSIVLAVGALTVSVIILLFNNRRAETRAKELYAEAQESSQKIEASEKELRESLKQLTEAQEEERKRQWAAEGLASLTNIMRQSDDLQEVFDQITSYIVNYTEANQGALFSVEREDDLSESDENTTILLKSTYAYGRKKFVKREIDVGEGLIGQAFLEKDYIYMTEVPDTYVRITSGLGEARPRAVLIMPLMENDVVRGFIEMASFKYFHEYQIEFMKNAGEAIAAFVRSSRVNERTRFLLEQSQQQAEEMRAQEEEMRQNAEEMQATQEEMHRKEKEYLARIQELEGKPETADPV